MKTLQKLEEQYKELASKMPGDINWEDLIEKDDNTEGSQTLACTGVSCEIA